MPDDPTVSGETPAAPAGQVPAPQSPPAPPAAQEPTAEEPFDKDRAKALIDKLREEAKQAKAQVKDFEATKAKLTEFERSQLSETDKLKADLAEAQQKAADSERRSREALTRSAVVNAASKKNAIDPDAVYRLLDASKITYDDDGSPQGVDTLVSELLKEKAYLVQQPSSGSPANPQRGGETPTGRPPRVDIWDAQAAYAAGEGVIWNPDTNPKQRVGPS